jgi:membrane-anchored mycosin MYCP
MDVAAPGTEIITLAPATQGLVNQSMDPNGQVSGIQGTSFAAPYVSGVVALVRQHFPTLNAAQVMDRIKKTAQHPAGFGGRNNKVGYGMVNPVAALTAVIPEEHPGVTSAMAAPPRANLGQYKHNDSTPMLVAMLGSFSGVALIGLTLFVAHTMQRARAQNAQFARLDAARKRL